MKRSFFLFLMFGFLTSPTYGTEKPFKGKYEVIGSIEKLKDTRQIEMIEFFNYSCGHCYRFLKTNKRLHKKYKDKLQHIKYPIYWGNQTPYPARAFYIADQLGLEKKFTQELFDTNFKLNINIFQSKVIKFLATDYGISNEMTKGMQSKKIENKVNRGLTLAKQFEANETPTLIINKILKVTPSISGGDVEKMTDNLEVIFDEILNSK
tara:strand:+ start:6698 stop:7321 length:624 start_codon:yes stop_codon:yes gene_type:complete